MVIGRSRSEEQQEKWKQSARYWKALPLRSTLLFLTGMFCLFACFGFLASIFNMREASLLSATLWAISSGGFAVLWIISGTRRYIKLMIATGIIQIAFNTLLPTYLERHLPSSAHFSVDARLQRILITDAALTLLLILLGYIFFIAFAAGEGRRVFGALTELRLANEIHRSLVPQISEQLPKFEIAGFSVPAGAMGGDLVDVAQNDRYWLAYLADVSGHGVSAGIVMAMVKSAVRMAMQVDAEALDLTRLLSSLNEVLTPLSSPSTFVTFAGVSGGRGPELNYALAGHLPVLHFSRATKTVEEKVVANFVLGMFKEARFSAGQLSCEPGDVLALVTDGLTETMNKQDEELGLPPLKEVLKHNADCPLDRVLASMRSRALAFGRQLDDQSVLLIRRLPES
jgi:hypothetical protein